MIIEKIYIENFKGIAGPKIVDLSSNANILYGPNGFGKTTLFDAIEFCFTKSIYRVMEVEDRKKAVHLGNKIPRPFYKNKDGKTLIKLLIRNLAGDELVLCMLDDKRSPSYKNATVFAKRFRLSSFGSEPNKDSKELSDADLKSFLNLDEDLDLTKVFRLFNYVQQEENTYFLKRSAYERKGELEFLFQTSAEEEEVKKLRRQESSLKSIKGRLEEKIKEVEGSVRNQRSNVGYKKLFDYKDYRFDNKDPFKELSYEERIDKEKEYIEKLEQLREFKKRFSPKDYFKKQKAEKIKAYLEDEKVLKAFIFSDIFNDDGFKIIKKAYRFINDENKLKAYLLSKLINQDFYKKEVRNNRLKNEYEEYFENHSTFRKKLSFIKENFDLEKEFDSLANSYLDMIDSLQKDEKRKQALIDARNELKDKFTEFHHKHKENLTPQDCPFCGYKWENYQDLMKEYKKQTQDLMKKKDKNIKEIEEIKQKLQELYIKPFEERMRTFLKNTPFWDKEILEEIRTQLTFDYNQEKFDELLADEFIKYKIDSSVSIEEFNERVSQFKKHVSDYFHLTDPMIEAIKDLDTLDYSKQIDFLEKILNQNLITELKLDRENTDRYNEKLNKLKSELTNKLSKEYKYDPYSSKDDKKIFLEVFNEKNELFENLSILDINRKIDYIKAVNNIHKQKLLKRFKDKNQFLEEIISKFEETIDIYKKSINEYKQKMVDKIKIPFYLYTAKIIQNYHQGYGVFIRMDNSFINFDTGSFGKESIDEVMHSMSAGQIAVVSVAFTLSVNKVYGKSDNLKLIAIDDPIQEMDTLNIHSFTELLKQEFLKEGYQIILSTHSDLDAYFIKYKFNSIPDKEVELINVQDIFFKNDNKD
jgi:exonuclease SbcC